MSPYPNIKQTFGLLVIFVLLQLLISIPLGVIGMATKLDLMSNPLTIAVANLISIGLLLHFGLRRTRAPAPEVFPLKPFRLVLLLPMTMTIIGMSILLSEADNRLRAVLPIPPQIMEILKELFGAPQNFFASFLTLVIVAPFTEEFLFRGLVLRGFLQQYSVRKAVIVSALFFAIFHFNPWQFTSAAVAGVVLAWWVVKTRSLWPGLFGHALNNALPLILLAIPQLHIPGFSTELTEQVEFQPLWFDALGLLLAGAGIAWLIREFAQVEDRHPPAFTEAPAVDLAFPNNGQMENPQ